MGTVVGSVFGWLLELIVWGVVTLSVGFVLLVLWCLLEVTWEQWLPQLLTRWQLRLTTSARRMTWPLLPWRVRDQLNDADAALMREHAKARQAMNTAAGHAWKNPFE